jgi:uncharacterized SAM-binding protein YcdF (DUF218 family)
LTHTHDVVALYHLLARRSAPAGQVDVVVALGSSDLRTAERAAALYRATAADLVVCSGGRGRLTGQWPRSEAAELSASMIGLGVLPERIWIEPTSSNPLENAINVAALLRESGRSRTIALVTRPHLRLRAWLTFRRRFVADTVLVDPADTTDQPQDLEVGLAAMSDHVRSEVPRIDAYSARGDIDPPDVPPALSEAWRMVATGRAR